jgi:hypothetical protein
MGTQLKVFQVDDFSNDRKMRSIITAVNITDLGGQY